MTIENSGIDPEIFSEFLDESCDELNTVSENFIMLEQNNSDMQIVQAIFRTVHSLKGNAAFFGLLNTKNLAHSIENILDLIRKEAMIVNEAVINTLLKGIDELQMMLSRTREGSDEVTDIIRLNSLIKEVENLSSAEKEDEVELWTRLFDVVNDIGSEEVLGIARKLANLSSAWVQSQESGSAVSCSCKPLEQLKVILNDESINKEEAELKQLFEACLPYFNNPEAKQEVQAAIDNIDILGATIGLGDPVSCDTFTEHIAVLESMSADMVVIDEEDTQQDENKSKGEGLEMSDSESDAEVNNNSRQNIQKSKTMRISEESIDNFLNFVGELVTLGEMYNHFQSKFSTDTNVQVASAELRRINEMFHALSSSLQKSLLAVRLLPMNTLFQKIPRMVRDIALVQDKKVDVVISGEGIRVDKSIIDTLDAPITHMVRNAADHGIEPVEDRIKAGKSETGLIEVSSLISGDSVILIIQDDGKGLNLDALKEKALKLGVIKEDKELTNSEIVDLLFQSGVSTADQVTDISGRGVGMDVVKRSITSKGGDITVETTQGHGSIFTITLPMSVSTIIIKGFVTSIMGQKYIIPVDNVENTFIKKTSEIFSVSGKGNFIKWNETIIPAFNMSSCFGAKNNVVKEESVLIVLISDTTRIAVSVDEILGIKQFVLKPLEGMVLENNFIKGAAIMGDSSIALVLDVDKFVSEFSNKNMLQHEKLQELHSKNSFLLDVEVTSVN